MLFENYPGKVMPVEYRNMKVRGKECLPGSSETRSELHFLTNRPLSLQLSTLPLMGIVVESGEVRIVEWTVLGHSFVNI